MGWLLVRTAPAMKRMGWLCAILLLCLVPVRLSFAAPDSTRSHFSDHPLYTPALLIPPAEMFHASDSRLALPYTML